MTNALTTQQAAALNNLRAATKKNGGTIETVCSQDGVEVVAVYDRAGRPTLVNIDRFGRLSR